MSEKHWTTPQGSASEKAARHDVKLNTKRWEIRISWIDCSLAITTHRTYIPNSTLSISAPQVNSCKTSSISINNDSCKTCTKWIVCNERTTCPKYIKTSTLKARNWTVLAHGNSDLGWVKSQDGLRTGKGPYISVAPIAFFSLDYAERNPVFRFHQDGFQIYVIHDCRFSTYSNTTGMRVFTSPVPCSQLPITV